MRYLLTLLFAGVLLSLTPGCGNSPSPSAQNPTSQPMLQLVPLPQMPGSDPAAGSGSNPTPSVTPFQPGKRN
jgi:hypothetical protein